LVLTGFALAACGGGGDFGDTTCGNLDIPATGPCLAAGASTSSGSGSGTTTVPIVPPPTGTGTTTNTGNTTTLATGDKTVALEFGNLISPATGSSSKLTEIAGSPNQAKLAIDTKTATNNTWPIPKTMDEYPAGTAATAGLGLGGAYKEYRALSYDAAGTLNDEELQVWHWGNSYATQYRDVTAGGGDARHQAWSFGGSATPVASMPGGIINYTGRYGATAKTWGWVDPTNAGRTMSMNGSWQVQGAASVQADLGANTMSGTLTPGTWTGYQSMNGATGRATVTASNLADPNFNPYMNDNVILKGTIAGNTVTGTAKLDPAQGWVSGVSPMYAGFYGAAANEVTGAYNFVAVSPDPIGGQPPINDDRRGFVQQSGVFHGQ
jgi:hypothetical protein